MKSDKWDNYPLETQIIHRLYTKFLILVVTNGWNIYSLDLMRNYLFTNGFYPQKMKSIYISYLLFVHKVIENNLSAS